MDQEKLKLNLKKLGLTLPLALLTGFVFGIFLAVYRLLESGDLGLGLWRTAIADITGALNLGFFTSLNLAILILLAAGIQILFGREFAPSLRTGIGILLFYPLFFIVVWLYTDLYVSIRQIETHRLPALLRNNSEIGLYLKKYFLFRTDIWSVLVLFFRRAWWMLSALLLAVVFGYWFDRLLGALSALRRKTAVKAEAFALKKWTSRLLVPLGITVVAIVLANMLNKGIALTNQDPQPNVILISLDTLRADRLGCYGNERAKTPYIDILAQNGVQFESAISNSSWTLPGHGAMLTGVQPTALGLFKVTDRLDSKSLTLAEVLREHGYDTGAIVSYILLDRVYGFDQGFTAFDYEDMQPARQIVDKAMAYIAPRLKKKFFLFLHLYDPHWPYTPNDETAKQFWPGPVTPMIRNLTATGDYARFALKVINGPPILNDYCLSMYDGEIAEVDRELGRLFTFLYEKQVIDRTVVIVTSDHGEEFRDHGTFGHGLTLYDEALHVPLIMRYPLMLPEKVKVKGQVQTLDLFPTILGLVGIDSSPYALGGRDLYAAIHAGQTDPTPMIAETSMSGDPRYALRDGKHKLITPFDLDFGGNLKITHPDEVFDLEADPLERENLAQSHPKMLELLQAEMARQMEQVRSQWGMGEGYTRSQALSPEEIERLRSLGYLN